jgi:hypothetical protein
VYVSTSKTVRAKKVHTINRDAGTGQLVTAAFAKDNPNTTVTETVEGPRPPHDGVVIDVRSKD